MKTKKPSKQRKRFYHAKMHKRNKALNAHLNKELQKSTGKRSLMIKKEDKVKILRGKHKKKEGKIARVDHKKVKVFIDKITRKKADGTEKLIPFKASNLMIIELDKKDEKRLKRNKKTKEEEKTEKTEENKETKTKQEKKEKTKKEEK